MSGKWNLTPYAAQMTLTSTRTLTGAEWERIGIIFLHDVSRSCQEKDIIIGHIKGFLTLNGNGYYYLSTVSAEQEPSSQGESNGSSHECLLDFNVLVYGIEHDKLKQIIAHLADKLSIEYSFICTLEALYSENKSFIQVT